MSAENGEVKVKPATAKEKIVTGTKTTKRPIASVKKEFNMPVKLPTVASAAAAAAANESKKVLTPEMYLAKAGLLKLSSLTPARDLTLGGRGLPGNKKVYTPNLNVVRNKNVNVKTSKDTTRGGRGARSVRGERGARGGRVARGGSSALIQTTGLFSEGAGAMHVRKSSTSFGNRLTQDETASSLRRPIVSKFEKKIDIQQDDALVRDILDNSEDDDILENKTNIDEMPIKLSEAKWKAEKFQKIKIKLEKVEADADVSVDDAMLNGKVSENGAVESSLRTKHMLEAKHDVDDKSTIAPEVIHPQSLQQLLDSTTPQIFLMQLPDTLPFDGGDDDQQDENNKHPKNDETSKDKPQQSRLRTTKPLPKTHSLKEMEEGKVGKIIRYKSGRVKLILGESHFELQFGMEPGCMQELMSINTNSNERSGNMINLGPINAKVTAVPDWEHMLHMHDLKASKEN